MELDKLTSNPQGNMKVQEQPGKQQKGKEERKEGKKGKRKEGREKTEEKNNWK